MQGDFTQLNSLLGELTLVEPHDLIAVAVHGRHRRLQWFQLKLLLKEHAPLISDDGLCKKVKSPLRIVSVSVYKFCLWLNLFLLVRMTQNAGDDFFFFFFLSSTQIELVFL